jgi:hypothetical protein
MFQISIVISVKFLFEYDWYYISFSFFLEETYFMPFKSVRYDSKHWHMNMDLKITTYEIVD